MKILLCHNHYQQQGGEDLSFAAEADLLERGGHDVLRHTVHNNDVGKLGRARLAARTIWSRSAYRDVRSLIRHERPDVMHCTNTFPLLSPSICYAAQGEGVAVVQSLRNYRLMCPGAYLLRDGKVCEDCLGRLFAWRGIQHGCYRDSRLATGIVAAMSTWHRLAGTWDRAVDRFFTPSAFTREKYIAAGFPASRIAVKPNFIDPDPGPGTGAGGFALFVGRLSSEKGIETLLAAWQTAGTALPLKIVGDGPMADVVRAEASRNSRVEYVGPRPHRDVMEMMGSARCVIVPSLWYETFGRTIIEAFAKGTPVIASRLGCMEELIDDGETGWLFNPGDADDLASTAVRMADAPAGERLRAACRQRYLEQYTASRNYQMLLEIYDDARARHQPSRPVAASAAP